MKFSAVKRGKRAEKPVEIPLEHEGKLPSLLVALTDEEDGDAHKFAIEYAKKKGVENPQPSQALYDKGYMAKVLHFALRDPDTGSPGQREPTFTGGAEEIMNGLQRETVLYLFALVETWTDEVAPLRRRLGDADLMEGIRKLAAGGTEADRFLGACGPATRNALLLFSARLAVSSPALSSFFGGSSEPSGTPESSPPSSSPPPA